MLLQDRHFWSRDSIKIHDSKLDSHSWGFFFFFFLNLLNIQCISSMCMYAALVFIRFLLYSAKHYFPKRTHWFPKLINFLRVHEGNEKHYNKAIIKLNYN